MSESSKAYVDHLREQWSEATDGSEWTEHLEAEVVRLRDQIDFWSFCTRQGMFRWCPEREDEFAQAMIDLGISPYASK